MTDTELKMLKKYAPFTLEDVERKTGRDEETIVTAANDKGIVQRMDMWLFTKDEFRIIVSAVGINHRKVYGDSRKGEKKKKVVQAVDFRNSEVDFKPLIDEFRKMKSLSVKEIKPIISKHKLGTNVDQVLIAMEAQGYKFYTDDFVTPNRIVYMGD